LATAIGSRRKNASRQHGFSLLEVVISMAVLTIALVSLLGVFGLAIATTQGTQEDMIAKQLANEALESIVTARNTAQLAWSSIQNVSNGGLFLDGYQSIYQPGADGISGTADDITTGTLQTLVGPGPDGIYGTADDVQIPLNGYQRQIQILPVVDNNGQIVATLRSINVTVRYTTPGSRAPKTYVLNSLISQYR